MHQKTVFLSYNHSNKKLREKLELLIPKFCPGTDVVTDENATRGKELHKEISKIVNSSHIVIPIITSEWLSSNETRDELVRAHERRKHMICFMFSDDFKTNDDLPFYLRDALRVHFTNDNIDEKIRELCDGINNYTHTWKREIFDDIRILGDYLDEYENSETYKMEHLRDALRRARSEVSQIVHKDGFKRKVSYEDNFLRTASPYFRAAKSIAAISIAEVATFWDDPEVHDSVNNYLEQQSSPNQNVVRLFVFSNPVEANYFKNILQANYRAYGKNGGGVFLCSRDAYTNILLEISRDRNFLRLIEDRDFGVLTYKADSDEHNVSAILDAQELAFETLTQNTGYYNSYESFLSYMQSLLRIQEGEAGGESPCLRWSNDFYKYPDRFSKGLEKIFHNEYGPILHLVLVKSNKKNYEEVKECLHLLKAKFESEEEELDVRSIWLRERKDIFAHDGRFLGRLITNKVYDFVLGLEFENEKALQNYYQHKMHSVEREILYITLDKDIKSSFDRLNKLQNKHGTETEIEQVFSEIEKTMKKHLIRIDVRLHEKIENIVKLKGVPFGSKYDR